MRKKIKIFKTNKDNFDNVFTYGGETQMPLYSWSLPYTNVTL